MVPGPQPRAHGGDVLLRITPGPEADVPVSVAVWAVAAGTLVPVADWDLPGDDSWAERVRPAPAFAMSALTALEEYADLGAFDAVDLDAAAGAAVTGLPWPLPGRSLAVAAGDRGCGVRGGRRLAPAPLSSCRRARRGCPGRCGPDRAVTGAVE